MGIFPCCPVSILFDHLVNLPHIVFLLEGVSFSSNHFALISIFFTSENNSPASFKTLKKAVIAWNVSVKKVVVIPQNTRNKASSEICLNFIKSMNN